MTPANPSSFFEHVRIELFGGFISQPQVNGISAILDAWPGATDTRWIAYSLGTAYHETSMTMQPIAEYGRGQGRPYGVPVGPYRHVYYGRGLVQLTWLTNYAHAEQKLPGSDLVRTPDNALIPHIASEIMVNGMSEGWFTGMKLADYFNYNGTDWINARRIINGLDNAAKIAGYAIHFRRAIENPTKVTAVA